MIKVGPFSFVFRDGTRLSTPPLNVSEPEEELTLTSDDMRDILKALGTATHNHHSHCMYVRHNWSETPHKGPSYRHCKAQACIAAMAIINKYKRFATPENHNKWARRNYLKNIQRASQSLETYLGEVDAVTADGREIELRVVDSSYVTLGRD